MCPKVWTRGFAHPRLQTRATVCHAFDLVLLLNFFRNAMSETLRCPNIMVILSRSLGNSQEKHVHNGLTNPNVR
ncbi:hypothetical protein BDR03DRAFT_964209 [Suillus americanus]|nr:hypothetical protein BDR03DRAFT_964209 [Suillus americanus]